MCSVLYVCMCRCVCVQCCMCMCKCVCSVYFKDPHVCVGLYVCMCMCMRVDAHMCKGAKPGAGEVGAAILKSTLHWGFI